MATTNVRPHTRPAWLRVVLWALLVIALLVTIGLAMYGLSAGRSDSGPISGHATQSPVQRPTS